MAASPPLTRYDSEWLSIFPYSTTRSWTTERRLWSWQRVRLTTLCPSWTLCRKIRTRTALSSCNSSVITSLSGHLISQEKEKMVGHTCVSCSLSHSLSLNEHIDLLSLTIWFCCLRLWVSGQWSIPLTLRIWILIVSRLCIALHVWALVLRGSMVHVCVSVRENRFSKKHFLWSITSH